MKKKFFRIGLALLACTIIMPFVFGAGWAFVNIGIIGSTAVSNPELAKKLKVNIPTPQQQEEKNELIKSLQPKAILYLSIFSFILFGIIYGLIAGEWKGVIILFLITIILGNPVFFDVPISKFMKFIVLVIQIVLLYGTAYFFSRITLKSKNS